jgi:hypothetical protein
MGPKRILTAEQRARKSEVQKATRALKKAGTEYYIQPQHCNDKEHKQPSKHYCAKGKPLDVCKAEHAPTEKDPIRIGAIRSCNPCYLVKERERQMKPEIVAKKLEYAARPEVKEGNGKEARFTVLDRHTSSRKSMRKIRILWRISH